MLAAGSFLAACGSTGTSPTTTQLDMTVRGCWMVGSGGLAADYRHRALVLGPLALGNLRTYKPDQPLPGTVGPRRGAYEVIAIVKAGSAPVPTLPRTEWGVAMPEEKCKSGGQRPIRMPVVRSRMRQ